MSNDMSDYMKVAGCGDPNANAPTARDLKWKKLVADRDALATENAKLREALRREWLWASVEQQGCRRCGEHWKNIGLEYHTPGCLAAPQEPRT